MSAALQQKPEIKIKLTVAQGPHAGQVFQLSKSSFTIGRGPENDVVLMNDPLVSRSHAQISVVESDLEIRNLSQKNAIFVEGQNVQKWKIANNSGFTIGDTEFKVEYDLGQAVVSVQPAKPAEVVPLKPKPKAPLPAAKGAGGKKAPPLRPLKAPVAAKNGAVVPRHQVPVAGAAPRGMVAAGPRAVGLPGQPGPQFMPNPNANAFAQARTASPASGGNSLMSNPRFKFYLIILLIAGGAYYYLFGPDSKKAAQQKIVSTLKYEDAVNMGINSQAQKDAETKREAQVKERNSLQAQRVQENLIKGMRDFQLGNYSRAQEFYQLVLNLEPDNQLARRYIYLAKVRFDEIVQEKLMLGESYFKKHNFRMCASLYRQVVVMLQGKNNDQKLLLAEKKAKECQLADEGIR